MNDSQRSRTKISVEDLLQLKRAERPSSEFWADFDRQLRAKQLAAIVDVRPWWKAWPVLSGRLTRYSVSFGAVALCAAAFVVIRNHQTTSSRVPLAASLPQPVVQEPAATVVLAEVTAEPAMPSLPEQPVAEMPAQTVAAATTPAPEPVVPALAVEDIEIAPAAEPPPSARSIAANFAAAQTLEQEPAVLAHRTETPGQEIAVTVTAAHDEMQIPTGKRARLLALTVSADPHAPSNSDAAPSRERITRRLTDQALYDSITRLGLTGQSVSIKF